jgi:hypothetical protein
MGRMSESALPRGSRAKPYTPPTMSWMLARVERPMLRVLLAIEHGDAGIARKVGERTVNLALRWGVIEEKVEARAGEMDHALTKRGEAFLDLCRIDARESARIDSILIERAAEREKGR